MTRTAVAVLLVALLVALLHVRRCRFCTDLCAHDEWPIDDDWYPCDPRLDELQAWASYYERELCE